MPRCGIVFNGDRYHCGGGASLANIFFKCLQPGPNWKAESVERILVYVDMTVFLKAEAKRRYAVVIKPLGFDCVMGIVDHCSAERHTLFRAGLELVPAGEPPNLDNILSMDRIVAYKNINPEFIKILKQACIVRNSEKGWFRNIKEKLL